MSAERTISEAARELALPERTLRRYLEQFRAWVPTRRRGRVRVLDAAALDVLRLVREHLVAGKTLAEVERLLAEHQAEELAALRAEVGQVAEALAHLDMVEAPRAPLGTLSKARRILDFIEKKLR